MASIRLDQVHKRYGEVHVVKGVDLEIEDGEFVVLVGPSGCGKSTTLRMIAGLETITEGTLHIGDRAVNDLAPRERDVAMVFQSYALYPHLTVRRNIAFGLELRGTNKAEIETRVAEAAELLGLGDLLDRKPAALSGGQRQRVAMGRAIVRRPAVYLFDEPLSNLDAKLRAEMRAQMGRLHRRLQTTTVYVTHDQVEAMTLAERIVVMNEGIVQQLGPPLELYQKPANRFVATFIGSPSMNLLQGEIDGSQWRGANAEVTAEVLSDLPNGKAELGVRPEDLVIDEQGELTLNIEVLEPLGSHVHALGQLDGQGFTAQLPASTIVSPGETVRLAPKQDKLHFFGADGQRLEPA